jgi:hypothetical protein
MKKHGKGEKKPGEVTEQPNQPEQPKKTARREFLSRTGLTAGGVLMTTLAASGLGKGQSQITTPAPDPTPSPIPSPTPQQPGLLSPDVFRNLFTSAWSDTTFQNDIQARGFAALDDRGYQLGVPADVRASLETALFTTPGVVAAKPKCGVCGVCGLCGLCGELNLGSASAALWALFTLAS